MNLSKEKTKSGGNGKSDLGKPKADAKPPMTFKEKVVENIRQFAGALGVYYVFTTFVIQNFTIPTGSMEVSLMPGDFIFVNKFVYGAASPFNIPFTNVTLPQFRLPAFKEPKQGDVVVFRFPHPELMRSQEGLDYIKRCVAVAGQTLEVRNKNLIVDGVPLSEKFYFTGIHYDPTHVQPRPLGNVSAMEGGVFPPNMGSGDNFGPFRVPKKGDVIPIDASTKALITYLCLRDDRTFEQKPDGFYVDGVQSGSYTVGQDYFFMMGDNRDNSLDSRFWGPVPRDHVAGEGLMVYWSNTDAAKQTNLLLKVVYMFNVFKVKWWRIGTIIR